MAWCSGSLEIAKFLCKKLLDGLPPCEAAIESLKLLGTITSTCIEDIGRQVISIPESDMCIQNLSITQIQCKDINATALLFMIAYTYYRRLRIVDKMQELLEQNKEILSDHPVYLHAKAMWIEKSDLGSFTERILLALKYEEKALNIEPDYAGAKHKFADLIVQLLEEGWSPGNCPKLHEGCIPQEYVIQSEHYLIELSLELRYPRAYYTYARLKMVEGAYSEALDLLNYAISLEPSNSKDYMFRLAEYYNTFLLAKNLERLESKFKEKLEDLDRSFASFTRIINDKFEKIESRILMLMSFYIGIIAIIFTFTSSLSNTQLSIKEIIILNIFMLLAVIIIIFVAFIETKRRYVF